MNKSSPLFLPIILFLALMAVVVLPGCSGVFDGIEITGIIPPTAMQEFEATGGNTIHLTDMDALNTVTVVTGRSADGNVTHPVACGQLMTWNVSGLDPVNYAYWIGKEIIITYDPDKFGCNQTWFCDVPRDANGDAVAGSVTLETGFGARLNVTCVRRA